MKLNSNNDQICDIPITSIDLPTSLNVSGFTSSDKYIKTNKSKKNKKKLKKKKKEKIGFEEEDDKPVTEMVVNRDIGEMPDGAVDSDGAVDVQKDINDPHTALDIDLDVPEIKHPPPIEEKKHKKKKKEKKKKSEKSKKSKKLDNSDKQLIEIKQGYEEALGICTPSKEIVQTEDLSFNKLAMDKYLLMVNLYSYDKLIIVFTAKIMLNFCFLHYLKLIIFNLTIYNFLKFYLI